MKQAVSNKKRILVVDDNADLLLTLQGMLEREGYEVFTSSDGAVALKFVLNNEVDAVICDLEMPQLEGNTFYTTVERVAPHLSRSFIFISGVADDARYREFFDRVGCPVLGKPMDRATLLETLSELLKGEKQAS